MIRKIIHIDEEKCNGCGACVTACHEGAIGLVNGKARLMRDDYCDGFGDCLPGCQVLTNEQLGLDSSAKEAVAFAVLANEALYGCANNAPGATGAAHGVVMGKISL
jgi:anhydro-N-acetylmuramic acid kinase